MTFTTSKNTTEETSQASSNRVAPRFPDLGGGPGAGGEGEGSHGGPLPHPATPRFCHKTHVPSDAQMAPSVT